MLSRKFKRPTIKDVAVKAGVCKTTVSHAFSGRRPVSARLNRKILRAAEKLGYRPHYIAQTLPRGRTRTIAVLVRDLINQYNSLYLQAIEEAASARGYHVYVCIVGTSQDKITGYLQDFTHGRADGVLIATSAVSNDRIVELAEHGYPVLAPLRIIPGHSDLWPIQLDIAGAFRRLLEYLYGLGHRQMGFIWHLRAHTQQRIDVLRQFALERNIELRPEREVADVHSAEQAFVAASKLLRDQAEISALVCANDMLAAGAEAAAHSLGLKVPGEISVAGFGDVPMGRYCRPAITTVHIPITDIANAAVGILLDRIEGKPAVGGIDTIRQPELLIRESCGPAKEGTTENSAA